MRQTAIRNMTLCAAFTGLLAVSAQLVVPSAVPFTMQTFGLFLTMAVLGGKRSFCSVSVYLALGLLGLPVFSGFSGGIGHLFGPSGGFLLGFFLSPLVLFLFERVLQPSLAVTIGAIAAGLVLTYLVGTMWFVFLYLGRSDLSAWTTGLISCVLPFIVPDGVKLTLALVLRGRIAKGIHLQ